MNSTHLAMKMNACPDRKGMRMIGKTKRLILSQNKNIDITLDDKSRRRS